MNAVSQKVFILDQMDPEVIAMLQAFYSRSDKSIGERIADLGNTSDKIKDGLRRYYLGYGHASIGDCGDTTLFLENVSMVAAKAIQDDPLYNGQETSTRYFDFEHRACLSPLHAESPELTKLQDDLVALYSKLRPLVLDRIRTENPLKINPQEDEGSQRKRWENATNARAFDIVRSLLPAGMTTQLSWKGSLRRIGERLRVLASHPCTEVSALASSVNAQLVERYPNSFKPLSSEVPLVYPFYDLDSPGTDKNISIGEVHTSFVQFRELNDNQYFKPYLVNRKRTDVVPNFFNFYGQFHFEFLLDYGSFRDIQRHRNGLCPLPMLGAYSINGESNLFHPWYLEQLGEYRDEVEGLLNRIYGTLDEFSLDCASQGYDMYDVHAQLQYYYPLGTVVPVTTVYGLAEAIYVTELRTAATVHPTLRQIARAMARSVNEFLPEVALYVDNSPDGFVLRRGSQTILEREVEHA